MNKINFSQLAKNFGATLSKHSPEILTGFGIAGMITTTILAVKATPKALKLIDERKKEEGVDKLTPIETVKATWKCYIPAAVTGATSVACIIGASSIHLKRNTVLATAYKISETALTEYRDKVVEVIGEKKEQAIQEKLAQDRVDKHPVTDGNVLITDGNTTTLCLDYVSGRYFYSDIETIRKGINEINRKMLIYDYVSLNDFYDEIGLDQIELGDELGWNTRDKLVDISISACIAKNKPCMVVNFTIAPKRKYDSAF